MFCKVRCRIRQIKLFGKTHERCYRVHLVVVVLIRKQLHAICQRVQLQFHSCQLQFISLSMNDCYPTFIFKQNAGLNSSF